MALVEEREANVPTISRELATLPAGSRFGLVTIARSRQLENTRKANDEVLAAAREAQEKFFAVVSVHPADGDAALTELERTAGAGARMLKLHPNSQNLDLESADVGRVVEKAAELGLPILFDAYSPFDPAETGKFLKLSLTHPKAKLVLAHTGGPAFVDLLIFAVARKFTWFPRNVWLELSAVNDLVVDSPLAAELVHVCRRVGVDRVVFGSDYPVFRPVEAVANVNRLGFTADELKLVLHDNAAALLKLP